MSTLKSQKTTQKSTKKSSLSSMVGGSTRLTLTYVVFVVWVALAVFAMLVDADLYSLAAYFASGLPIILGYLWAETSRPTPSLSEVADIVKSIGTKSSSSYTTHNGLFGDTTSRTSSTITSTNNIPNNITTDVTDTNSITSIYSDDASVELKVNSTQLTTLMNTGYVDIIGDKYTFKKSLLDQIKSLINDNSQTPNI